MSMVGYILGLGDRHPSNLMLDRFTGKILHIDFGDCFEVAMQRDKFPERVPFRLTRMLVNAMEVCHTTIHTCQHLEQIIYSFVMAVHRLCSESYRLAVLLGDCCTIAACSSRILHSLYAYACT
jgi:Phosphatidylinositol 3- and 4-kinase